SDTPSSASIHPRLIKRCSAGYNDPCSTWRTSSEFRSMAWAMAWPCAGPRSRVRRTSMSSVPCRNSMRSFSSVDILGEEYGYSPRMSRGGRDVVDPAKPVDPQRKHAPRNGSWQPGRLRYREAKKAPRQDGVEHRVSNSPSRRMTDRYDA